jgi:hypothetical protein
MFNIKAIFSNPKVDLPKDNEIKPWKKIASIAFNIFVSIASFFYSAVFLLNPTLMVAASSSILGVNVYRTLHILLGIRFFVKHLNDALKDYKVLSNFWESKKVKVS